VLEKGVQINPISAKLPLSDKLTGTELANFQVQKNKINTTLQTAITREELENKKNAAGKTAEAKPQ
jgi:hypothetical protein